ncbi:MAG: beta-ketoacyl-ACP synthase II [Anaerolineales bacterium]|nr:beta-ketoacyl-ACP synthase II [Anaerolineales bacterium]
MEERIVVTGMGTVNPLGLNVEETWKNAIEGVSGVGRITQFDPAELGVQIACEVKGFDPADFMDPKEARRRDRFEQLGSAAARQALKSAGLEVTEANAGRIGVVVSSAIGGLNSLEGAAIMTDHGQARRVSPFLIPMLMPNGCAGLISIENGLQGPSLSVASACASGLDGMGVAWMLLRSGAADVILAGAAESTICKVGVAAFDRVGALSRRNDDFSMTPQPFDKNRDGLVMGEGGAVLVLERDGHARARGADILAEFAGYSATADAFHITAPSEDGSGGARAILQALELAGANPEQVSYINAHGTATQLNDKSETQAIKKAFGEYAYKVPVSSTKSMTGHMMGATGALEAILCVKTIREGIVPPTIHYETPDPDCDLDYVPNQARDLDVTVVVSNAFGFGGHNAAMVMRRYD